MTTPTTPQLRTTAEKHHIRSTVATARALKLALALLVAMLIVARVADAAGAALRVPAPTGAYHVGTHSIALTDPSRRDPRDTKRARSLVVQLWYPAAKGGRRAPYMSPAVASFLAKDAGLRPALLEGVKLDAGVDAVPLRRNNGWPVVLFSPGYGVERELYTGLTQDLASHGYVVAAIDHPRDAGIVAFPDGHVVLAGTPLDIAKALVIRVADTRFVLTQLARLNRSGAFASRLDLSRVGMFGHSLGGATAAAAMLVDPRVRAGADLDGALFEPARTRGLSRPFLLMKAEPGFAADPNVAGFWGKLRGPRFAVDVEGALHFAFSDLLTFAPALMRTNPKAGNALRQIVGRLDGTAILAAERAYVHAFFDQFLRGKRQPLLTRTPGPYAGVRLTVGR